jgi:hypothetical protein
MAERSLVKTPRVKTEKVNYSPKPGVFNPRYPTLKGSYKNPDDPATTRVKPEEFTGRAGNPEGYKDKAVNQPAGKTSYADELESSTKKIHSGVRVPKQNQTEFDAKEVKGGMKRALNLQLGIDSTSGETKNPLGDANPKKRAGTRDGAFGAT